MLFFIYLPFTLSVSGIILALIVLALVYRRRRFSPSKKQDYIELLNSEILFKNDSQDLPEYGASLEERVYNQKLNERKICSLKCLDLTTKSLLINNNIETVGDLKFSSLDFLVDMSGDKEIDEQKLNSFFACKNFIIACQYKKGKSHLDF